MHFVIQALHKPSSNLTLLTVLNSSKYLGMQWAWKTKELHLQWQGQGLGLYYNNGTATGLKDRMTKEILFLKKKRRGGSEGWEREEVKNELRNAQTDFNWLSFRTWEKKGFKLWSLKNCYNHEPTSIISNKEAQKNTHLKKQLLFWTCAHLFLNDSTPMNETALLGSFFFHTNRKLMKTQLRHLSFNHVSDCSVLQNSIQTWLYQLNFILSVYQVFTQVFYLQLKYPE